ncbi:MAG: metallophosphoesterase [archaeon]|nr:MAG: metallophosphoesterase [archaeon]
MKILAIGDPHGKLPKNLGKLIKKNKPELIICTGELPGVIRLGDGTGFTDEKSFRSILKKLTSFKLPLILMKGNSYVSREGSKIFLKEIKKYRNVFYKKTGRFSFKSKNFILFDMVFEIGRSAFNKLLKTLSKENKSREKRLNQLLKKTKDPILISHAPPFGYLDKVPKVGHVGSKIVLRAIKKHKPKLVLCGHIHEGKGKTKIGKTVVYNLGEGRHHKILNIK